MGTGSAGMPTKSGGKGIRTPGLFIANDALCSMSASTEAPEAQRLARFVNASTGSCFPLTLPPCLYSGESDHSFDQHGHWRRKPNANIEKLSGGMVGQIQHHYTSTIRSFRGDRHFEALWLPQFAAV